MKKLLKTVLFVAAVSSMCVSCGGDEDESESKYAKSSLTNPVISGNIELFTAGSADTMAAIMIQDSSATNLSNIGQGVISSSGSFSFTLATPADSNLTIINPGESYQGTISDPTALVSSFPLEFVGYKGVDLTGIFLKSNFSNEEGSVKEGAAYSIFVYSNKVVTISGKSTDSETDSEAQMSISLTENDNFTLEKGWNELVCKINTLSVSVNGITEEVSVTNAISSDLKWRLWSVDNSASLRSSDRIGSASLPNLRTPRLFSPKK